MMHHVYKSKTQEEGSIEAILVIGMRCISTFDPKCWMRSNIHPVQSECLSPPARNLQKAPLLCSQPEKPFTYRTLPMQRRSLARPKSDHCPAYQAYIIALERALRQGVSVKKKLLLLR